MNAIPSSSSDGILVRLGRLLDDALRSLDTRVTPQQLESLAVLIHEAMSGRGRSFHSIGHVFDLAQAANPHVALAAAFHDAVYLQVDGGLSPRVEELLAGAFQRSEDKVWLTPSERAGDRPRAMVMALFNMKAGTAIAPTAGLNEMLSALLAVRALAPLLPERTLIRIAAAIESTIPFRGPSPEGEDPTERLRQVLDEVSRKFALGLRPDDLDAAVADGVELANRDVANFAFDDPAKFLDNTWSLLPETNWSLRVHSVYSARDYRTAMERMEGFLSHLDAERVFRAYHGQPPAAALAGPIARARRNVDTGARYLGAKLAASCLLDALAQLTGGDAPVALLMGDLPTDEDAAMRMEQFLPAGAPTANDDVWRLLAEGRASPSGFDLKNAPLAAYLYSTLPGLSEAVQRSRSYCAGGLSAEELLRTFPTQVVAEIARACAQVAFFRREPLLALAARFSPTV